MYTKSKAQAFLPAYILTDRKKYPSHLNDMYDLFKRPDIYNSAYWVKTVYEVKTTTQMVLAEEKWLWRRAELTNIEIIALTAKSIKEHAHLCYEESSDSSTWRRERSGESRQHVQLSEKRQERRESKAHFSGTQWQDGNGHSLKHVRFCPLARDYFFMIRVTKNHCLEEVV